jgi:hypothetical protein
MKNYEKAMATMQIKQQVANNIMFASSLELYINKFIIILAHQAQFLMKDLVHAITLIKLHAKIDNLKYKL